VFILFVSWALAAWDIFGQQAKDRTTTISVAQQTTLRETETGKRLAFILKILFEA
jgi:hypothetical protein